MRNIILFDSEARDQLLPLTYTRPVAELRVGILTIREKWEQCMNAKASYITQDYLSDKYPIKVSDVNYIINGNILPTDELVAMIEKLASNEALLKDDELIAAKVDEKQFAKLMNDDEIEELAGFDIEDVFVQSIDNLWDIFSKNDWAIKADYAMLTRGRTSQPLSETNQVLGAENVFLEAGAKVECAILNATKGPIYIGKNAEIMEGSVVRGPLAMCEHSVLKLSSKIYGATTLGPYCKAGGELNNVVMTGYSNKGHDGFLGNAVLGEWCNLGADTNNSNLKNNYAEVKLWNYTTERFAKTGLQFCGLIMGDHSKCGINTMFNTGTVVGVSANVFGEGFPRNFIPSYAWGGKNGYSTYKTDKAFETAEVMMGRRGIELTETDKSIMNRVFIDSARFRRWEKKD